MALLKEKEKKSRNKKRPPFLGLRVWLSYLVSVFNKDTGVIPPNLGYDKMLVSNNMYVTKLFLNSIIMVVFMDLNSPITYLEEITREVRNKNIKAIIDYTFINEEMQFKEKNSGLSSRIRLWENGLNSAFTGKKAKERYARLLYTVDEARSGKKLIKTRLFITVRAKTGTELKRAEEIVHKAITKYDGMYLDINDGIYDTLNYISILSKQRGKERKRYRELVNTNKTLSQMLPNCSASNGTKGIYMGYDVINKSQFFWNDKEVTRGRNFYVVAPTGVGKTVIALNMVHSAYEQGNAICLMDIKGNEFRHFTEACNGYTVSLTPDATEYLNSWIVRPEDCTYNDPDIYFKEQVNFSKLQMRILAGITSEEEINDAEELLDEFHNSMYISLGVTPDNKNSWKNTYGLNPYVVYQSLLSYMSTSVQQKYPIICRKLKSQLKMYWTKEGSKSYSFRHEFECAKILDADVLTFAFGLNEGDITNIDANLFRLKFAYMSKLNAEFVSRKFRKGTRCFKVLEESQIVNDDILKAYVKEYTLGRSQGQTTIMLGNSIKALENNKISKPLIENTTGLLIGKLVKDARDYLIETFDLQEYSELLATIGDSEETTNAFLFINRMEKNPIVPILKVSLSNKKKYKLYTPSRSKT